MSVTDIRRGRGGYQPRALDCEGTQSAELIEMLGIDYRRLEYWTQSGRVRAHYHLGGEIHERAAGIGSTACYLPDQVKIAGRIVALMSNGFRLEQAFQLATDYDVLKSTLAQLTYIDADMFEDQQREHWGEAR